MGRENDNPFKKEELRDFYKKSCLSQWWPWERWPILVVMKNPSKGFLGSLNRADQPIVLCPDQTTISDFLHTTSEIFLLSTKTKKLKNLPTLSAKTRSLENTFFLGDLYTIHRRKNRMFPFFDLVRVWNPQLQREHTDWSPNLFCPPQLWIFYMHILYFLNFSLVCSNLENFTCTNHTFSNFPFSIRSNCLSLYEARGSSVLTQNMICLRNWHVAKKQIESSWPSLQLTSYRGQNLGWPIQSSLLSRPSCQSGFRPIH